MATSDIQALYLQLMKSCVKNLIYLENEFSPIQPRGRVRPLLIKAFQNAEIQLCHDQHSTYEDRVNGKDHTSIAHTMVSMARLDNLQICIESVIDENIPGDLIETGVLRGGASIFMKAVLKANGITNRLLWLADSFEGLPAPNIEKYPADAGATWHQFMGGDCSLDSVRRNFERYGLLDDQVRFLQGWFRDTLPTAPVQHLAIIRLDGDLYESTMDALVTLYPKLSVGGYLIIDDYYLDCCRKAVEDYRQTYDIREPILNIDGAASYWKRQRPVA